MKNVFFNSEVLDAESKIISSLKIPSVILMENAGKNFTKILLNRISEKDSSINNERNFIVLTGKGNNAGDGFVIARHLCNQDFNVTLVMLFEEKELQSDAAVNFSVLKNSKTISENLKIYRFKNISDLKKKISFGNSIIIDAIFGVGFRGAPDKKMTHLFKFLNQIKSKTLFSVDVPSGLSHYNQDTELFKADVTISMGVRKFHTLFYKGRENSGEIETADIGISENEFTNFNIKKTKITEEKDVRSFIPERKKNSNKYTNGKVLVIAGSKGLTGAVYLSSVSAMKTGSGAVIAAVPESVNDILEIKMTEVMTLPVSETSDSALSLNSYDKIKTKIKWADTILIGPGLSKNEETMELVRYIVKNNKSRFVIDADAIYAFRGNMNLLKDREIIITPHFGEFSSLTGIDLDELKNNFYKISKEFAVKYKVCLVLKNSPTIITDGNEFIINPTGRENLATAGSGDVLSGIISALFSQTGNAMGSAVSGTYLHGKCGDILFQKYGSSSTLASDIINEIPFVKNQISSA